MMSLTNGRKRLVELPEICEGVTPTDNPEMERNGVVSINNSKSSVCENAASFEENRVNLEWKNIRYEAQDGFVMLKGLSGSSKSGELTAIMGPSGSGKTSLVNVLSGFSQKRVTGQVLVNGAKRDMASFRKITCYILQDDHILPRFTVRELITFASKLKIPETVSEKERQKAVDNCIYNLGLVPQQNQRANTLSGGQKKRLCIAQEIVNNPPLIFLDEPTSGLDSSSCLQCIQLLKSLSEQGKNVICTIHQPSSRIYEIFDNLYMLSDGDCIYKGPTKELIPYLDSQGLKCPKYYSPTDFITDVAIGLYGEWNEKLKEVIKDSDNTNDSWCNTNDVNGISERGTRNRIKGTLHSFKDKVKELYQDSLIDMTNNNYSTSNFNQFRVLLKRCFLNQLRDPINMKLKCFGSVVIGLLLGSMYYDTGNDGSKVFNTAGLLFTLMVFIVITAKVPTVLTFPLQRTIFEREHRNGWYSTKMYYLATTAAEMPYQILCPMINCGLLYWLSGQPNEWQRLCLFMLSGVLVALISESIGMMIGSLTNVQNGFRLLCILTAPAIMLNGALLPISLIPVFLRWMTYVMYTYYGLKSMFIIIYSDRPSLFCSPSRPCFFKDPKKFLKFMERDGNLIESYIAIAKILIINAIFISSGLTGVFVELTGFFLPLKSTPAYIRWLCLNSFARHGFVSFLLIIYENRSPLQCTASFCYYKDPSKILKYFGATDLYLNLWKLLSFLFVSRILCYVILQIRASRLK